MLTKFKAKLTYSRIVLGRWVMLLGLHLLPYGKVKSELFQLLDIWSTKVKNAAKKTKTSVVAD